MPLYDFQCAEGHRFERMVKLANFQETQICTCNAVAKRLISRPMISVENVLYDCPITGQMITSKHQHEENLKLHGCRVFEPGEREGSVRAKAKEEEQFEKALDDTIDKELSTWSSDKMEKLTSAIEAGADIAVERT